MGRSRDLNAYSPLFWEIVEQVAVKGKEYARELPTRTAAISLRGKFYAFRGALKRELDQAQMKPELYTTERLALIETTHKIGQSVVCWVGPGDGPVLVKFMHRDQTPESVFLREMLAQGEVAARPPDEAAAKESQRKLLEKLEQDPAGAKKYY